MDLEGEEGSKNMFLRISFFLCTKKVFLLRMIRLCFFLIDKRTCLNGFIQDVFTISSRLLTTLTVSDLYILPVII